jgi:octaprenyl-diphosphate synthase
VESLISQDTSISAALKSVVEAFDAEVRSDVPFLSRLLDRVQTYRGKLLRPRLLLLSAEAVGGIRREHVVLGAVVEMVHAATLVHDDVLDEADVRRRCPTVNRLIGNEGAVLLGDYLISHAYHLCSSLDWPHASRRIAAATNTVCEGELMQIARRGDLGLSREDYLEIIRRKTGALTSVCCELGAEAAGAEPGLVEQLAAFGMDLGVAFQIVDDVLDLTASEDETGKSMGRDADLGKLTLPVIQLLSEAGEADRERFVGLLSGGHPDRIHEIRGMLESAGAIAQAMDVARGFVQSAVGGLGDLPDGPAKAQLLGTAEFVLQRRH